MATRSDTFDRADNTTSLGTSSSGHTWSVAGGSHGILSNTAYTSSTGNNQSVIDLGEAGVDVTVTLAAVTASGRGGIVFRSISGTSTADDWRFVKWTASNTVNLIKTVASVVTNNVLTVGTLIVGDKLRVIVVGDRIRTYVNSTLVHDVTDSALNTGTWHGIQVIEASGVQLEDWSATSTDAADAPAVAATAVANTASRTRLAGYAASTVTVNTATGLGGLAVGTATAVVVANSVTSLAFVPIAEVVANEVLAALGASAGQVAATATAYGVSARLSTNAGTASAGTVAENISIISTLVTVVASASNVTSQVKPNAGTAVPVTVAESATGKPGVGTVTVSCLVNGATVSVTSAMPNAGIATAVVVAYAVGLPAVGTSPDAGEAVVAVAVYGVQRPQSNVERLLDVLRPDGRVRILAEERVFAVARE